MDQRTIKYYPKLMTADSTEYDPISLEKDYILDYQLKLYYYDLLNFLCQQDKPIDFTKSLCIPIYDNSTIPSEIILNLEQIKNQFNINYFNALQKLSPEILDYFWKVTFPNLFHGFLSNKDSKDASKFIESFMELNDVQDDAQYNIIQNAVFSFISHNFTFLSALQNSFFYEVYMEFKESNEKPIDEMQLKVLEKALIDSCDKLNFYQFSILQKFFKKYDKINTIKDMIKNFLIPLIKSWRFSRLFCANDVLFSVEENAYEKCALLEKLQKLQNSNENSNEFFFNNFYEFITKDLENNEISFSSIDLYLNGFVNFFLTKMDQKIIDLFKTQKLDASNFNEDIFIYESFTSVFHNDEELKKRYEFHLITLKVRETEALDTLLIEKVCEYINFLLGEKNKLEFKSLSQFNDVFIDRYCNNYASIVLNVCNYFQKKNNKTEMEDADIIKKKIRNEKDPFKSFFEENPQPIETVTHLSNFLKLIKHGIIYTTNQVLIDENISIDPQGKRSAEDITSSKNSNCDDKSIQYLEPLIYQFFIFIQSINRHPRYIKIGSTIYFFSLIYQMCQNAKVDGNIVIDISTCVQKASNLQGDNNNDQNSFYSFFFVFSLCYNLLDPFKSNEEFQYDFNCFEALRSE